MDSNLPTTFLFEKVVQTDFTVESLNEKWDNNDMEGIKSDLLKENIKESILKYVCLDSERWQLLDEISFIENSSFDKAHFEKDISQLCNGFEFRAFSIFVFLDDGFFTVFDKQKNIKIIRCKKGYMFKLDSDELYAIDCRRCIKLKVVNKSDVKRLGSAV